MRGAPVPLYLGSIYFLLQKKTFLSSQVKKAIWIGVTLTSSLKFMDEQTFSKSFGANSVVGVKRQYLTRFFKCNVSLCAVI